ncbi:SMP-30/gluconolactonase/LRE family protein [Georgenia subflava]|uniref:SMP-30/gluconolactonase/LRE family protein n=1 Tax=Georgenia subflava TaxID=1622177 RepID=A0A6N7EHK2_9MICO|nr:SMP-30/gluconolactonase/LRE family protein [Georgenia subflava]MPV36125.1 SMP-30/gluconolactonase/LRE family protein [Georgenia subflava]
MRRAEQITDVVADHGEGPVWSPTWGGLRLVDMLVGDLLTLRADGGVDRMNVGRVAAVVRPRRDGGYVVATEVGIELADDVDNAPTRHVPVVTEPGIRTNEGTAAPDGSLYVGTSAWDQAPDAAALYRITPQLAVEQVLGGVTISNGMGFSPDGSLAYYVDSKTGLLEVFDVDAGRITNRRPLVDRRGDDGELDGLVVDAAGTIWVAVYGAGEVLRYDYGGRLLERISLPVPHVTACTLGGPDLTDLFVTTSRGGLGPSAHPAAGALFRVPVDVPGLPVAPFAG